MVYKYKIKYNNYNLIGGEKKSDPTIQQSIFNPKKLNYMEPSKTTLYKIPKGTILYHGSLTKEAFNPYDIRLGDDRLVSYFLQIKV